MVKGAGFLESRPDALERSIAVCGDYDRTETVKKVIDGVLHLFHTSDGQDFV